MVTCDKRYIWKNKSKLELMLQLNEFITKHGITTVRQYQVNLKQQPGKQPSLWFIKANFGSWEQLLIALDKIHYNRYRWNELTDSKLKDLVSQFIAANDLRSQRAYEKKIVGQDLPSLSTLRKRFGDIRFFFATKPMGNTLTDYRLLEELKKELFHLGLQDDLSMTKFRQQTQSKILPSVDTILRRTGKSWEDLMFEIGFDYRSVKRKKLTKNFK